jgi:ankyrin repeat protein
LSGESDLEMDKISREINLYLGARVSEIRAKLELEEDEEALLLKEVRSIPHRTYLWAHLTLDLVEGDVGINKTRIRKIGSPLPRTVDEAYERILDKSPDFENTKRLLHIIVAATRPLSTTEMQVALAIHQHDRSYKDLDLVRDKRFRRYIRDICGLFVTIIDLNVYLLHQTAREFLVEDRSRGDPYNHQLKWKSSLLPRESHRILFEICASYLLFTEFDTSPPGDDELLQGVGHHVFLDYSATSWVVHFRASGIEDSGAADLVLKICDSQARRCITWFRVYWESVHGRTPPEFTSLMIVSYFGLDLVVQLLLDEGANVDAIDSDYGRTPLSWAAERGHEAVVRLLLDNGAAVDAVDNEYGQTPLSWAIEQGHEAVVRLLLDKGAAVDAVSKKYSRTPLLWAARGGNLAIVRLLLDIGAAINDDRVSQTPLSWAARRGHKAVVRLLLDKGEAINTVDRKYGQTPLSWAAERGQEAMVRLLLDEGAVIDIADKFGRTPLSWAAERGHEDVVRLLLSRGANVDAIDSEYGRTPLSWAAERGHEAVVQLLLDNGACHRRR